MAVNQLERACAAWPVLIQVAKNRDTISYGKLGDEIGVHHRAIRYVLGLIQDYCLSENLPPLTILVVNGSGRPGDGFIAHDLNDFNGGLSYVWDYDWKSKNNPFEVSESIESHQALIDVLVNDPETSNEIYSIVPSRGMKQILFRSALLRAYKNKCAFTELSFPQALEACHIIPWAQASDAQRLDIRNGILLNSFHHKLFDRGVITISTDHDIIFCDPKEKEGEYSKFDKLLTSKLHGNKMHLPFRKSQRPLEEYIRRHHLLSGWEF